MARMVLVHGAFSGAWCWEPVLPGLRAAGYEVEAVDLPGQGEDTTPVEEVSLDRYAARVCEVLNGDPPAPPAVLVGHSMGGMVITQAAALVPEQITVLIYVAAFLPNDGESLVDLTHYPEAAGDMIQAKLVVAGDPPVATLSDDAAREAVYNCCTDEQAASAVPRRGPQPVAPFGQAFRLNPAAAASFKALPRRYVVTLQDHAVRLPLQRLMLERAGCEPVIELDADHAPQVSRTDELVTALDRLASLP